MHSFEAGTVHGSLLFSEDGHSLNDTMSALNAGHTVPPETIFW